MKTSKMRQTPAKTPKSVARSRPGSGSSTAANSDPVNVYCRVRPMRSEADMTCMRVISPSTIILTPPEMAINYKSTNLKETQHTFKRVFDVTSQQKDVFGAVAQPLVESLIRGKNGLLFTYGVTGSGKTYTMTGNAQHQGIMPRCLDVLFRTISDYQTKKFVFKPDRLNGFEIQTEADAHSDRETEFMLKYNKLRRKDSDPEIASRASSDVSTLSGIEEDNMYAVFITYIEVYNNNVYDLLEEGSVQKSLQSRIIREDATHNMYIHGVTELEVKSVEDAIEAFSLGQKRKRMGHTILNSESSRSHSVFTIRLVQAPTDNRGEYLLQDKRTIIASQLSLVDLAGSERTNRTKNTGQRLREAGNINNSLMTLRTCLEILRENQTAAVTRKVPYRDSKLTHLFKNYFDGEGHVRMVVCVNPRAEDYDETAQVMRFAEMTQDVQISKPTPRKIDLGLTPGRRKANQIFKMALDNLEEGGQPDARRLDVDLGLVYSLGPKFPSMKLDTPELDSFVRTLMDFLQKRIQKRTILVNDLCARQNNFRMQLHEMEKNQASTSTDNSAKAIMLHREREKVKALESKVVIHENTIDELSRKLRDRDQIIEQLRAELYEKRNLLNRKELEKEKQRQKYTTKIAVENEKMSRELELKLREQKNKLKDEMRMKDEKLRQVKNILNSENMATAPVMASQDAEFHTMTGHQGRPQQSQTKTVPNTPKHAGGVAVANPRHRRSKSAGDKWLAHTAANPVPLGTVFQPYLPHRKSVSKLTEIKDVANNRTSKYCLISQTADTDGELETRLFKGDIIPTMSGGAQVVLNDVECLKQASPVTSPNRKRPSTERPSNGHELSKPEVAARCSMGIEGHYNKKPRV